MLQFPCFIQPLEIYFKKLDVFKKNSLRRARKNKQLAKLRFIEVLIEFQLLKAFGKVESGFIGEEGGEEERKMFYE